MKQLNIGDIKVGYRFMAHDNDDGKWYLSEITEVFTDRFIAEDISNGEWGGTEWEIPNEDITDITLYKSL
jgi:hypothetical protein